MNVSFAWKDSMRPIRECPPFVDVERTRRTFICLACISGSNNLETVQVVGSVFGGKSFRVGMFLGLCRRFLVKHLQ